MATEQDGFTGISSERTPWNNSETFSTIVGYIDNNSTEDPDSVSVPYTTVLADQQYYVATALIIVVCSFVSAIGKSVRIRILDYRL
jgi:mitochondrial fission protein ELM1